ncbi:hypothetical protein CDD80_5481 [Ophiocordyceps camponoti-rufipedis]|uniref:Uncharacterized protein n=1 Tax=Ophiocordyceps camponoti-rufipedis TaxID=2004952 RepID=A0A2C5YU57_9HYPO|nr:hypothetical protein CDD80_5481 [Ophiocordyceps camponoti-rufipedis]
MSRPTGQQLKVRAGVAACIFGVAVTLGTLFGASLKTEQQKLDAYNKFQETSPDEKISVLEDHKALLLTEKAALEKKLSDFQQRLRDREAENRRLEAEWQLRRDQWLRYDQEQRRKVAERNRSDSDESDKG